MHILAVDTNMVFSAIVKPGKIRELLFDERLAVYGPEELAVELEELRGKILKYTSLTPSELDYVLGIILRNTVKILPRSGYAPLIRDALTLSPGPTSQTPHS